MAREKSYDYFWNSDSDRYYDADSMGDWLRPFFSNGIFNGQMQVTANGNMSVTVADGYGYINGKHRHFLTPTTLDLEVASGTLNRIDAVMLRRDDTERRIYLLIEKGGNAAVPTAPQPTREGKIYELKLADIYIAAGTVKITQAEITDTRMDANVCGWVAATVKQINFTQIKAQFDSYFEQFRNQAKDDYDLMIQAFNTYEKQQQELYETWIKEQESGFSAWFELIKGQLDEDAAGNLQNQIGDLESLMNTEIKEKISKLDSLVGAEKDLLSGTTNIEYSSPDLEKNEALDNVGIENLTTAVKEASAKISNAVIEVNEKVNELNGNLAKMSIISGSVTTAEFSAYDVHWNGDVKFPTAFKNNNVLVTATPDNGYVGVMVSKVTKSGFHIDVVNEYDGKLIKRVIRWMAIGFV